MIRTYRVIRGFALNYGNYTDVAPGDDIDIPEQVAKPYLLGGKLLMRTGNTGAPVNPLTGNITNPDIIVTRDPIPAKISGMGGGKRRKY